MQLVASSTVGIAAAGLALGRPERSSPARPASRKRKVGDVADIDGRLRGISSPIQRPATTSTMPTSEALQRFPPLGTAPAAPPIDASRRPSTTRLEGSSNGIARRFSLIRNGDSSVQDTGDEPRRDSISSRGSWLRRFSITTSQNNSPRSSVGPESSSVAASQRSAALTPSNPSNNSAQLSPNKLVKRSTAGKDMDESVAGTGSRLQVPTLRRPATSRQRAMTLQQRFREHASEPINQFAENLFKPPTQIPPSGRLSSPESRTTWRPFFESRQPKPKKEKSSGRSSDGATHNSHPTARRVLPDEVATPVLLKPEMVNTSNTGYTAYYEDDTFANEDEMDDDNSVEEEVVQPGEACPVEAQRGPRRSFSTHFSSSGSWISRAGSIRGNKRNPDGRTNGRRYSSAPMSTLPGRKITTAGGPIPHDHRSITDPTIFQRQRGAENSAPEDSFAVRSFQTRSRNSSSPLPPLSRLSSFNIDMARLGLSSSSSSQPRRSPSSPACLPDTTSISVPSQGHLQPSSPSYYDPLISKPHRTSEAMTLVGSEADARAFTSGDEDDMDFQSETVFDSLRSGATGSLRSRNTPLDSMFDESPPSVNGSKNKRLSIHELLVSGNLREGNNRIVEEDEAMPTPVKGTRSSQERAGDLESVDRPHTLDPDTLPSQPSFSLATKDFGRLSLDDEDEDEDWTRDDEDQDIQQLSPPSTLLTFRRVSPISRTVLADVTHSGSANGNPAPSAERPKSNLFDWSEPSSTDKIDYMGNYPRPKTAHVKQGTDGRGGRTSGRRGPTALHVRSQSVPVVPDLSLQLENSKLAPKFGTWGLGGKGVSEEWDGDFEFDNDDVAVQGEEMEGSTMLVPPAIQASQENVVGHVGQIREVCMLVEDLKRLRLLARDKDLLNGSSAPLWKEAEGIIALAVPDEEDPTLSPTHSPTSVLFGSEVVDERFVEHGPDAEDISRPEAPFEVLNRHGQPTGLVYDGDTVRRRSVFSPDDEIFGNGPTLTSPTTTEYLRPPPASSRPSSMKASSEYARSVMQTMHQTRSTSDPLLSELTYQSSNKMPFDTTSLRDLVHRASVLRNKLSDIIRKSDGPYQTPESSPKRASSPAFTRVFTDPMASPPKHLGRTQSNSSVLTGSTDISPTRSLHQHMHMMTVV